MAERSRDRDRDRDRGPRGPGPVPMRLFAAWEVDRTPANCVPRLCSLTITHLSLCAPLAGGLTSVILAARMHSSKRTLRSNEIQLPPSGQLLDTDLDLNFSLQYPHFVKRDGNRLQILLQRRKKYKSRTILGYKTIAEGIIRMDQVLQRSMDMELELNSESSKSDKGDRGSGGGTGAISMPIARITVHQLSSTPVDHDTKNNNTLHIADRGYSDEEEEAEFSSVEDNDEGILYTNNRQHRAMAYNKRDLSYTKLDHEGYTRDSYLGNKAAAVAERDSDSDFENRQTKRKGGNRGKMAQRNLKQKFVALLKRFRVPEELESGATHNSNALEGSREIDELFQELESLSCGEDSGPELDTLSISSTPKPSLRPFFASSRSLVHHDGQHSNSVGRITPSVATPSVSADTKDKAATPAPPVVVDTPTQPTVKERRLTVTNSNSGENDQWRNRTNERIMSGPDGTYLPFLDQDDNSDQPMSREQSSIDHQITSGSPPKEKDEKKSRLFRSSVSGSGISSGGKKKQQQSLTISTEQQLRPTSADHTAQSPTNVEPRRSLLEQISRVLGSDDQGIPECLTLVYPPRDSANAALLAARLSSVFPQPTLVPHSPQEVRAILQGLFNKVCKYCNTSAKPIQPIKVILVGPDILVSGALRAYVDLWSLRPADWVGHVRFYIIPLGINYISRYLTSVDSGYSVLFGGDGWLSLCDRAADGSLQDTSDITNRINRYLNGSGPTMQLPVAEAMVAYREKVSDEDSSQIFVPFVNDVRIGSAESAQHSVDLEEALGAGGGSPPAALRPSPPGTPAPPFAMVDTSNLSTPVSIHCEPLELQLDYWQIVKPGESSGKSEEMSTRRKLEGHLRASGVMPGSGSNLNTSTPGPPTSASRVSLKSTFRSLQVARLTPGVDPHAAPSFHITYATKEKKQKIMRLGKKKEKDKDTETGRSQTLENVSRLICSAKSSNNVPLKVYIDGTEWNTVKFFQLSTQWQTHVKSFPVALLGAPLAPQELT